MVAPTTIGSKAMLQGNSCAPNLRRDTLPPSFGIGVPDAPDETKFPMQRDASGIAPRLSD